MSRKKVYTIEWEREAAKQFKKINNEKLQERLIDIIENEIAYNPLIGKPLSLAFKGVRSYRLGVFRILYKPYNNRIVVVILRVEHRKSVYKRKK